MADVVIVVVEDNAAIARLVQEVLNDVPGYRTVTVDDGERALEVIAALQANLVISDVELPGLDGFALYDRLRSQPDTATIPCVFMSASRHDEELARRNIDHFLPKPFDLDELLERVQATVHSPHASGGGASS